MEQFARLLPGRIFAFPHPLHCSHLGILVPLLTNHDNMINIEDNDVGQEPHANHCIREIVVAESVSSTPDRLFMLVKID